MYSKTRILLSSAVVTLVLASLAFAQHDTSGAEKKPLSPPAKAEATIAGKKVTIDYSAPSVRGRKIYGDLVPYGQVWRTGANAATTLKTEADLLIGATKVPAGTYTLYTVPDQNGWKLIINKQTGQWGTDYDQAQDLGRVEMQTEKLNAPVETFKISIANGKLTIDWENTRATVDVKPAS
jgi:hypothetical protein